jgi:hypothetical protein
MELLKLVFRRFGLWGAAAGAVVLASFPMWPVEIQAFAKRFVAAFMALMGV